MIYPLKKLSQISISYPTILSLGAVLAILAILSQLDYLLFHAIAELFSIAVAYCLFIIIWNTRRFQENGYLLFIGIAFFFVGNIDLIHTLAFRGMNLFHIGDPSNVPTQLWIAARYLESLSFLAAALFIRRKFDPWPVIGLYAILSVLIFISILGWQNFPTSYITGVGLTPFKVISEYIVITLYIAALVLFLRNRNQFSSTVVNYITASILICILSEFAFTEYMGVYDFANMLGHEFKIIAYFLVYKAIIDTGLNRPIDLLFWNLKQRETDLQKSQIELENRVIERTRELSQANKQLQAQIAERERAEATVRDLNKDLEKALAEEKGMRLQLIQAEKHATISRMIASVAHELNNPIQTVQNCLYIFGQDIKPDSRLYPVLTMASSEADRISDLVSQLHEVYRPGRERPNEIIDVNQVLSDVRRLIDPHLAHNRVEWIERLPQDDKPEHRQIFGNLDQIKQVLLNLSMNAIEAMRPKGGSLNVEEFYSPNESQIGISFQDTGPGIPPENISKLFDPFFTTKENGNGLGLAICYDIIDRHGGKIQVESLAGQGARFTVWLPLAQVLKNESVSTLGISSSISEKKEGS